MRKFSSYGPVDIEEHYHVPRKALIEQAYTQLIGENPDKGGHYITVWAPRQRGKSWVMQQVWQRSHQPTTPPPHQSTNRARIFRNRRISHHPTTPPIHQ